MTDTFGLSTIGQVSIRVRDLDRAVAFYQQKLGMTYLFTAGHIAFFQCDTVRLMLNTQETGDTQTSILYFKVGDIDAAVSRLKERGVAFEGDPHLIAKMPDHDLWMAFFKDSEGNTTGLMSEVATG